MLLSAFSSCFATYFRIDDLGVVTDVDLIIAGLRAALTLSPPAASRWIEPTAGTFRSPARDDEAFLTVTVTKLSATRLSYVVRDEKGFQVNGTANTQQDIAVLGNRVIVYSGPMHLIVDSRRTESATAPEVWCCGIAERAPEPVAVPRPVCFASVGPRNSSGTIADNELLNLWIQRPGATAYTAGTGQACVNSRLPPGTGMFCWNRFTIHGGAMAMAVDLSDGNRYFMGRFPQVVVVDICFSVGYTLTLPIDAAGNAGVFQVTGFNKDSYQYFSGRLAARIG